MTTFDNLQKRVEEMSIAYPMVDFPIKHLEDGLFESYNHVQFRFSVDGAGYLSERNTNYKYAQFTRLVRNSLWEELELLANKAMMEVKGSGKRLIFAVLDGYVVGILKHYNTIPHQDIISVIQAAHLDKEVVGWNVTDQYMSLDLQVRSASGDFSEDDLIIALRVLNGHSGHHALKYQLLVKARGFEYTDNSFGRSRHLSGVSALMADLEKSIDKVREIRLDLALEKMSTIAMINLINDLNPSKTVRQEALMHLVDSSDVENALDVFILLGQYANTKGYASAVNTLLTPVIEKILSE